jgi:hypothetical protein
MWEDDPMADDAVQLVKIWPRLLLVAIDRHCVGSVRVWFIANTLPADNYGMVEHLHLVSTLNGYGINERNRQQWFLQAIHMGFLIPHLHLPSAICCYRIASPEQAAWLLGCFSPGSPAAIPVIWLL